MYVTFKLWGMFNLCILHSSDDYGIIFWGKTISMYKIFVTKKIYRKICRELIQVPVGTDLRNWRFQIYRAGIFILLCCSQLITCITFRLTPLFMR